MKPVRIALAIAARGDRVLLARRPAAAHLGGLWEFPGGKIEGDEDGAAAALRELAEETGLRGGRPDLLAEVSHSYPDRDLILTAYLITGARGEPRPLASDGLAWHHPGDIDPATMPPANGPILERLGAHPLFTKPATAHKAHNS